MNFSYYTGTFLVGAHRLGVPFPKLQTFSEIFWTLPIDYSLYKQTILKIFFICLFTTTKVNLQVTKTKVNFRFYK